MLLPRLSDIKKQKKKEDAGSYNAGGAMLLPNSSTDPAKIYPNARATVARVKTPSTEPGTGNIGMEGNYVKPKTSGASYYKPVYKPAAPVRKGTPATVKSALETQNVRSETDPARSRAEGLGIGTKGQEAWADENEKDRSYSGAMATYKIYWDAGYNGTEYKDVDNPISDYVSEDMKKRAYAAGLADARRKQELAQSRKKAYNENAVSAHDNAYPLSVKNEKQPEPPSQYAASDSDVDKIKNEENNGTVKGVTNKNTTLSDTADKGIKSLKTGVNAYNDTYDSLRDELLEKLSEKTSTILKDYNEFFDAGGKTSEDTAKFAAKKMGELFETAKWAFSEIGNNVTKTDIEGQREFWRTGADLFLRSEGMDSAAWLLEHALENDPEPVKRDKNSRIAKLITKSKSLNMLIKNITKNTNEDHCEFTPKTVDLSRDAELFYALNNATVNFMCDRLDDGNAWVVKGHVSDYYDFTEFLTLMSKNGFVNANNASKGTVANDLAHISQLNGAIKPYPIDVDFEFIYSSGEGS